jgi:3-oxoacyl-[acyl-carrier protein] reductase
MNLEIKDELFFVSGATSGFGKAIAIALLKEGAKLIINARGEENLQKMKSEFPDNVETLAGDITTDAILSKLQRQIGDRHLSGLLVNAGGPPAVSFIKSDMAQWDDAYKKVLRWKVKLTQTFLPKLMEQNYGRIVYIESASVKQPIENLVLSNSLRLAVVGFVKTLSQEVAKNGITLNIMAPGYHATPAMERLFTKKSMLLGISPDEARSEFEKEIHMGKLGDPEDIASLALWLLSPHSKYVTGQTIAVDGGLVSNML